MEQIRCVKELKEHDRATGGMVRPRFMVWENVPGAFSSNGGKDFAAVLEETVKIVEPKAPAVLVSEKGWSKSGCIYDEMGRWSVAWRVHDAQFWGVPQRRKRIALVADFGGLAAPEVLFERKGLSRDFEQSGAEREEATGAVGGGAYPAIARSLTARHDSSPCVDRGQNFVYCLQGNGIDRADTAGCNGRGWREDVSYTLNTIDRPAVCSFHQNASGEVHTSHVGYTVGTSCNASARNTPLCYDARGNGDGQTAPTITGDHNGSVSDYTAILASGAQVTGTLMANAATKQWLGNQEAFTGDYFPLSQNRVRRLTPLECERLQGYPDGWTDIGDWTDSKGKKHKAADSPRYKALGNSIALPFWKWLLKRISAQYERDATLGSLFDGLGGFPYIWEQINGKGSALWASEVDEFCIAVTKERI